MDALTLVFVGDDAPGLTHALAEVVADHGANWERSESTELAGVLTGIVEVTVDRARVDDLVEDLRALDGMLEVSVRRPGAARTDPAGPPALTVEAIGEDHAGIVEGIAATVARAGASMRRFGSTRPGSDAGGAPRFRVTADLYEQQGVDLAALAEDLRIVARDLDVDLTLGGPVGQATGPA